MLFSISVLLSALSLHFSTNVNAFVVHRSLHPLQSVTSLESSRSFSSTCLCMAEDGDSTDTDTKEAQQEATAAGDDADTGGATDILNSPAFLKRKLEVLKSDIEKTETDLAVALERAETAKAEWGPQFEDLEREYANIRDRMSDQNLKGDTQAIVKVVQKVLELLDNFDRAYGVIKPETDADKAIEAEYKAAYQSILDTFETLGVTEVETVGKEFDYELHQAIMQMPGTEYEDGICCQEFQKGFLMEDTLIRPAMVAVAM